LPLNLVLNVIKITFNFDYILQSSIKMNPLIKIVNTVFSKCIFLFKRF